ncbi:MAG: hypothetical protein JEZ07_08875 [Phycisphaerae bacterium]|nr:hypothetical protein [Phycisphaerae bacterium]
MNKLTQIFYEKAPFGLFSSNDTAVLLPGSDNSRQGLVKRALANDEIIKIRRGLYCLNRKFQQKPVNTFAIAQHVYGPSYISLESALNYHGWIPEAVYACTNASLKNSKEFNTPLGLFSYKRVPQKILYAGVDRIKDSNGNIFLMATALKALADYIYIHKLDWLGTKPAIKSLRVEPDEFEKLSSEDFDEISNNYRSQRVLDFLKSLQKELKL